MSKMHTVLNNIKMLKLALFCILIYSLLEGCTTNNEQIEIASVDVSVRDEASSVFSEYSYTILESSAQSIIGNIEGLEVSDDLICARSKDVIFVFDNNGKFINKISHKGLGAGEYMGIQDFKLKDDDIWILSYINQAIFIYNKEGIFIDKIDLGEGFQSFYIYDDDTICLASEANNDSNYNFIFYNIREKKASKYFDRFEKRQGITFPSPAFIGRENNSLFVTHPFDYSVYSLTEDEFVPKIMFTFNTNEHLPDNAKDLSWSELYEKTMNRNVVCEITMIYNTKDYSYAIYPLFGQYGIIYNLAQFKDGRMERHIALCETIDKDFPYIDGPVTRYGDCLVSFLNASSVLFIEDNNGLDKFRKLGLKEDDNPVIFYHKLR